MLDQIERALSHYPSILQALIAIGTLGAVIASVAIALAAARTNRTKLRVFLNIHKVVGGGIPVETPPRYLVAILTNTGNLTTRIEFSFFNWKVPFHKEYGTVNPLDAYAVVQHYPHQTYPVAIPPRAAHTACLSDLATFKTSSEEFAALLQWARSLRMRFARAYVWTADGARFRVKISNDVRAQLIAAGKN